MILNVNKFKRIFNINKLKNDLQDLRMIIKQELRLYEEITNQRIQKLIVTLKIQTMMQNQTKNFKPIRLIAIDQKTKKLSVNQEAIQWLCQKVNQDKHIGVVTVVGKYRTGKSYILNRVLLNQNNGFEVGPTINACTKGLWVWPQLISCQDDPTKQYMVMDTEGLGSLEQGQQNDTKIFLMAMLLSSYFIYNSIGSIDEKAVQNLSLIINLSKMLQDGSERDKQDILNCFPTFMWLVRDFALRLQDDKGKKITPLEYLENALKLQKGNSDLVIRKNSIRKEMTNFFRNRDCFMLIRPVDDEKKLQDMSKVKDSEMRPRFLELIKQLQGKILKDIKKKTFKGKPCSPTMFIELCQYFCDSINKGGLPQIQSNWQLVCRAQTVRIEKKIYKQFSLEMDQLENIQQTNCLNMKQIEQNIIKKVNQWLKYYEKNSLNCKAQKKKEIKEKMDQKFQQVKKKLTQFKNIRLDEQISQLSSNIQSDISANLIGSIFQIAEKFDSAVQAQSNKANHETLAYLYKKCYEGLKTASFAFFGNTFQCQQYQKNLLNQRIGFYQNSLSRIQGQNSKKNEEFDVKQRELKRNVYQLQIKVRQAHEQLRKAKSELNSIYKEDYENLKQNLAPNITYC